MLKEQREKREEPSIMFSKKKDLKVVSDMIVNNEYEEAVRV
ncbi:MAG: hypothetical protein NZZ41_02845 [Candidatus Dojkabacteria bacterium]|nr:hypothetical protein [Candidatus Dojkabacteria bacterium]